MPADLPPQSRTSQVLRIGMVAGEASGDRLGAGLIHALKQRVPELQVEGIGGPQMQQAGCRSLFAMEELSVMGLFEVLKHLPRLLSIRRQLLRHWLSSPPDLVIGIDAPDFNLGLELKLHQAGIPTMHYVSPSVWAWRQKRVRKIRRAVDRILTLFPFEEPFYQQHGVPVTCVGHPFADEIPFQTDRERARQALELDPDTTLVALLPGSRVGEVARMGELFLQAAGWLLRNRPGTAFIAPLANRETRTLFEQQLVKHPQVKPWCRLSDDARLAMEAADVVLLASGTAALEAMLLKRPMVVSYRLHPLTYGLLSHWVKVRDYSLPNLLAGKTLVPEFIQDDATPEALGAAVLNLLVEKTALQPLQDEFLAIHASLRRNASQSAATAVLDELGR